MSNAMGQIIIDAQRMATRIKELDTLGSALLVEAEGNNRLVESLRQYQEDIDSLNRISNNKSNADMVNRIQQQNVHSSEILKENRELKVCIEDCERALEMVMQKYREHTTSKVLESKLNLREVYNEKLWMIIREQREKINEMAAVMQRAASVDEDAIHQELEMVTRLRLENKTLRELLQCSTLNSAYAVVPQQSIAQLQEKGIQTEADFPIDVVNVNEEDEEELSLSGGSLENTNNNSMVHLNNISSTPPPPPPSALTTENDHVNTATATGGQKDTSGSAVTAMTTTTTPAISAVNDNATSPANIALPCDNNNGPSGISPGAKIHMESAGKARTSTGGGSPATNCAVDGVPKVTAAATSAT